MDTGLQRAADAFKSVDWVVPAYIGLGAISAIGLEIERRDGSSKQDVLRDVLPLLYTPDHLAVMLLERYSKQLHVRDFRKPIEEAIEASFSGLWHAAITTLIPVIEGVLVKIRDSRLGQAPVDDRNWIIRELKELVERENSSPDSYYERVIMLTSLLDFCKRRLYTDSRKYQGLDRLNRHGILHGLFNDYADPVNFYRLISILELLCFVIALINGGSSFAPSATQKSVTLAAYYAVVKSSALLRPDLTKEN